jgi:hypothetical protein
MDKSELILTAIGMAMGIATVILGILKAVPAETATILLGIGLFAISLAKLQKVKVKVRVIFQAIEFTILY